MIKEKMIEEFLCPGCVCGSDTKCDKYEPLELGGSFTCKSHVLGTFMLGTGSFALGLPKGFNRAGFCPYPKDSSGHHNRMYINLYLENTKLGFDDFNVPVWALKKDGFLFIRVFRPRINESAVYVVENGTLDMAKGAINVAPFYEEMD